MKKVTWMTETVSHQTLSEIEDAMSKEELAFMKKCMSQFINTTDVIKYTPELRAFTEAVLKKGYLMGHCIPMEDAFRRTDG